MKLLIYARDWAPSVGGVQTITKTLADGLADWSRRHDEETIKVTLLTQTPAGNMNDSQLPYRVVRNPSLMDFVREIRTSDVIHLAGPTLVPLIIGYLLRKPTIVEHHGYQANCPNGLLLFEPDHCVCPGYFMAGNYRKCMECNARNLSGFGSARSLLFTFVRRWLCHRVARNIAITDHVEMRVELPRARTIYYGVPDGGRPLCHMPEVGHGLEIGYVGRLVQEKGLPVLLKAAKQLDNTGVNFRLTFIGDGPQRAELKALSDKLSLNEMVFFTGDLRGADLDKALRAIQIVVMPSEWEETAGLAAIEQMMAGGAAIVANIGGLAEVVGEAGLKFTPGNSEELCLCLKVVAEDRRKIEELGSMARARALKEFSVERFIMRHAALYQELQKAVPSKEHAKSESRQNADAGG